MNRNLADAREGHDLPVESRYFTLPLVEDPVSGRELLHRQDHDRELLLLLRILERGESGFYRGEVTLTRIW